MNWMLLLCNSLIIVGSLATFSKVSFKSINLIVFTALSKFIGYLILSNSTWLIGFLKQSASKLVVEYAEIKI